MGKVLSYGIVILAAGSSARMGQPKQLLEYRGKPLLQHAIDQALATGMEDIAVILGADAGKIKQGIKGEGVKILENPDHAEGMASAIRFGVDYLTKAGKNMKEGILIMLCDQPFVNSGLLEELIKRQKNRRAPIVTSLYGNRKGVPAVFHNSVFPELLGLRGDRGARKIIEKYEKKVETVDFPEGYTDIDTPDDYNKLTGR